MMKNKQLSRGRRLAGFSLLLLFLLGANAVIGQIAYWNCGAQSSWGTSPLPATTANANLTVGPLTRGAGLTTSGSAALNAWGANGWDNNEPTDDFSWTLTANPGYQQSLTNIVFYYRRSNPSGPNQVTFFYSLDGGADVQIGQFATTATATGGTAVTVPLSGFAELQNVPAGTVVKIRMTAQNATGPTATFYYNNTNGLKVNGTVTAAVPACSVPTGLAANNISDVSADLSWGAVSGATGYQYVVDQSSANPAGAGMATTATTVNETALAASTGYYLHVRTDCGGGNFSSWTTHSFTTAAAVCAAPSSLAANNITDVSADLSWTPQAGVTGYEYAIDQNTAAPASGTATTLTSVNETGLTASTIYYLHVRTDCGGGNLSPWTTISFTTLVTPCAAPAGLSASNITDVSADLSWTAQAGVTGYEYAIDQNAAAPASGTATTSTSVNETGLTASTTYYLHVRTDCGGGNLSPWTTISFTTLVTPCTAPIGLAANNITDVSADLSWTAQAGVTGYEYAIDQNTAAPASGTATTLTSVNETGLTASTTYYLHVRTDCGGGNLSPWTTISFTTLVTPCAAPTGLAANNITNVSADLSWTAQTGVTGYEYAIDQNAVAPASGTTTTATSVNETGLTASTTYYLHVRTDCGGGNLSPWTTISFTTLVTPCAAPAGLSASNITDDAAVLSWAAQPGADGYEYVINQNAGNPAGAGTPTTSTSVAQTGLAPSTTYYLHVRVDCGTGYSNWVTIPFQTVGPCPAPSGLNAANITGVSATLSWTAQGGADGYEYAVSATPTPPASGEGTTSATVNEAGLTHWTTYYLHVRTDCGGYFSGWTTFGFSTTSSVGTDELAAELFAVYPNPATDQLTIETNGDAVVTLLDVNGKQLRTVSVSNKAVITVADLEAGVYFLHFEQNGKRAVQKITKQ